MSDGEQKASSCEDRSSFRVMRDQYTAPWLRHPKESLLRTSAHSGQSRPRNYEGVQFINVPGAAAPPLAILGVISERRVNANDSKVTIPLTSVPTFSTENIWRQAISMLAASGTVNRTRNVILLLLGQTDSETQT